MTALIGLTGQTGAGKTAVSAIFAEAGFAVINADSEARAVLSRGSPCLAALRRVFGDGIFLRDGSLDRKAAARLIFSDSEAKARYEAIVFPYITRRIFYGEETRSGEILLDAPMLFESGLNRRCDKIVGVLSGREIRRARVTQRDGLTQREADLRMNAQHDEAFFRQNCDYLIENNGTWEELRARTDAVIARLRAELSQAPKRRGFQMNENGELPMENDELKVLREELLLKRENAAAVLSDEEIAACDAFCETYKDFISAAKTEREAAARAEELLKENGFAAWDGVSPLKAGDRIYRINRGKAVVAAVIGTQPLEDGITLTAAHIDSPRLDVKQCPIYEDSDLALLKTHYYGGLKKYQWTALPLALHGVVIRKDGTRAEITIGENESDPVFCVTDLLPHLAGEQSKRPLAGGIRGEELNLLAGSRPLRAKEGSDLVKLAVLRLLREEYGITEEDFLSAELEIVPAGKARDMGFDRSMICAYGQDDRVCAYPALRALLDTKDPARTAAVILTDKEEIGSDGNTGLCGSYFRDFVEDLAETFGVPARRVLARSKCLSADVTAAYDPTFPDVYEKLNAAFAGHGVCVMKYTGARGKSGSSDASAEYLGEVRRIFDRAGVLWQTGEIGKVDAGGGGTVAQFLANLNIDTVDCGVPVLSMHAPFEVVSKLDVYMAYKAFFAFQNQK